MNANNKPIKPNATGIPQQTRINPFIMIIMNLNNEFINLYSL